MVDQQWKRHVLKLRSCHCITDLARLIGVRYGTVNSWEHGRHVPRKRSRLAILELLEEMREKNG